MSIDARPEARHVETFVEQLKQESTDAGAPLPSADLHGDRAPILLVDDNPANLLIFETILAELNEPIVTAQSGQDALRKILPADFSAIVLDVNLPDMSGFEAAALIRKRQKTQHTPIIFVSAISRDEAHAYRGYSTGGVDYIFAPIVPEVLRTKVRVFVDLYKQRREVQRQAELLRDLQEREHRRELSETAEKLQLALDAGRMGVWQLDLHSEQVLWSAIPAALRPADPSAAWNTLERFVASMAPEIASETRAAIDRCRAQRLDLHIEPQLTTPEGQAVWIEIRARLLTEERERFVGVYLDITDRKLAEVELRRARDAAHEANRTKDRFLATLSHELRTPLTPALMAARGWLKHENLPPELRRDLQLIGNGIETESRLIDDLLDLTSISRGTLVMDLSSADFHEIVRAALQTVTRPDASAKTTLDVRLDARHTLINGDSTRLQQVIWNLVSNAYKFTGDGGRISITTRNLPGGRLELEVRDSGIGVEPDFLQRIFDAFEQGPQRTERRYGGMGLGLSICRNIVTLHDGTIQAFSDGPGTGTTIRVVLPLLPPAATNAAGSAAASRPDVSGLRILLVEDHATTAEVMSRLLNLNGHRVQVASTVESGIELAAAGAFDLFISDVGLPDGTGIDLLRRLRPTHATPAIALTGYGRKEDVAGALEAGFNAHLTKPVDLDELQATINRVIARPDPRR
jgi:signal transduction histidine kinase